MQWRWLTPGSVGPGLTMKRVLLLHLHLAEKEDKRLLLVIDEAEQLWSRVDDKAEHSVEELRPLAAGELGRSATMLCGSATVLPRLVSSNGRRDKHVRLEFPLVQRIPSLNITKYRTSRLPVTLPTDYPAIYQFLYGRRKSVGDMTPAEIEAVQLMVFFVGTTPSRLKQVKVELEAMRPGSRISEGLKSLIWAPKDSWLLPPLGSTCRHRGRSCWRSGR